MAQTTRISENMIRKIIRESIEECINEGLIDEGALRNAFKQKGKQIVQGASNMFGNMRNTYRAGKQDKRLQQAAQETIKSLDNLEKMAQRFNPDFAKTVDYCIQSIDKALEASAQNLQDVQANTFSTKKPGQQQNRNNRQNNNYDNYNLGGQ